MCFLKIYKFKTCNQTTGLENLSFSSWSSPLSSLLSLCACNQISDLILKLQQKKMIVPSAERSANPLSDMLCLFVLLTVSSVCFSTHTHTHTQNLGGSTLC